jgi:hypothetical protein
MEADVRIPPPYGQVDLRQPGKQTRPAKAPDTFAASKLKTKTTIEKTGAAGPKATPPSTQPGRLRHQVRSLEGYATKYAAWKATLQRSPKSCAALQFLKSTRKTHPELDQATTVSGRGLELPPEKLRNAWTDYFLDCPRKAKPMPAWILARHSPDSNTLSC